LKLLAALAQRRLQRGGRLVAGADIMVLAEALKSYIEQRLPCEHIGVRGDGAHFDAVIVSAEFRGKSRLQQHHIVYQALGDRIREEIHALSIHTMTPEEWHGDIGNSRGVGA
jgi:acid stress-induced BolA-like protein IbaG/YrbA